MQQNSDPKNSDAVPISNSEMSCGSTKLSSDTDQFQPVALDRQGSSARWPFFLGLASIVVLTLWVYLPAMEGGFIWDDDGYITNNAPVKSLSGLPKIWALRFVTKEDGQRVLVGNVPQYYPLVFTTFWLESRLWRWSDPVGFHVVNVLLHICVAMLIWRICLRLGFRWAFLAGAIFALHPVEVESVAWITERKNVLSGLFYLLAVLSYLRFDETRRHKFYAAGLLCFLLALLSKTVTCSLPVILLLILWLRHGRVSWSDVLRLIPFFAVGAVMGLFTAYYERHYVGASGMDWQIAFWQRCVIAGKAVFFYISKLIWPAKLTFMYPRWNPGEFSRLELLWPGGVIAVTIVLWLGRKLIGRAPLMAWAGFIVTLFPALGFVDVYPFRYSFVADHFQYHASIFFIALLAVVGYGFYSRFCVLRFKFLASIGARIALTSIVMGVLGYVAHAQAGMYADVETLWSKTIANNPAAWMAYNNRGCLYYQQGKFAPSLADFNNSMELNPDIPEPYFNRGTMYSKLGQLERAVPDFNEALRLNPGMAKAHVNLAVALARQSRPREAISHYRQALRLRKDWPIAMTLLAQLLATDQDATVRDGAEAVRLATRACELTNRMEPDKLATLAAALAETGQFDQAVAVAQEALQLAQRARNTVLANGIRTQVAWYKAQRPYRETIGR